MYIVFIRHLHPTTLIQEIAEELEKVGHQARRVTNVQIRKKEGQNVNVINLPLHRIELSPKANNSEILDLTTLLYTRVKVELPRKKSELPQCKNCQGIGHSKNFCHRNPKCVKCGEDHASSSCTKPRESKGQCANCRGDHTANYKGCPIFKEKLNSQHKPRLNIVDRMKERSLVVPHATYADKTIAGTSPSLVAMANSPLSTNKLQGHASSSVLTQPPAYQTQQLSPRGDPRPPLSIQGATTTLDIANLITNLQASLNSRLDLICARIDKLEETGENPSPRRKRRNV